MKASQSRKQIGATCLAILAVGVCVYPFAWMFFSSFKDTAKEIYNPLLFFPADYELDAFAVLFTGKFENGATIPFSFGDAFLNSFLIAGGQALLATFVTALAGYAFAKLQFRGKGILFLLAILVILVPRQVLAVPIYKWVDQLGLSDSLWSIIVLGVASGIGVIFFTQIFRRIPDSLIDLCRMEGSSEFRNFIILLPLVAPALVTYGLIHFILTWQEHLLPLLLLKENQTLPIALAKLPDDAYRIPRNIMMAASSFTLIPVALLFALFHKQMRSALREFTAH